jgi:hypothetical protein
MIGKVKIVLMTLATFMQDAANLAMYPGAVLGSGMTSDGVYFVGECGRELAILRIPFDQSRHRLLELHQEAMKFNTGLLHCHTPVVLGEEHHSQDVKLRSSWCFLGIFFY